MIPAVSHGRPFTGRAAVVRWRRGCPPAGSSLIIKTIAGGYAQEKVIDFDFCCGILDVDSLRYVTSCNVSFLDGPPVETPAGFSFGTYGFAFEEILTRQSMETFPVPVLFP